MHKKCHRSLLSKPFTKQKNENKKWQATTTNPITLTIAKTIKLYVKQQVCNKRTKELKKKSIRVSGFVVNTSCLNYKARSCSWLLLLMAII